MHDASSQDPLESWIGRVVVLDTQGPLIYIGTLIAVGPATLSLRDADVHDTNDSRSSKELYVLDARDLGVHVNRAHVLVHRVTIASASLLEDVKN